MKSNQLDTEIEEILKEFLIKSTDILDKALIEREVEKERKLED